MLYAAACSSDPETGDAGATPDAKVGADAGVVTAARGKYLVDTVLSCGDCHTPRGADGKPIAGKYLSGVECFADVHPPANDGQGCLHSANLTNDATGLKSLTDAQVKALLVTGKKPDGSSLADVMPYWVFSALADSDADSVVAYLRTVPAVAHEVPANEAPFDVDAAARRVTGDEIPKAASGPQAGASTGRYLATVACLGCHSPDVTSRPADSFPQDVSRAFQGGRDFKAAAIGLPVPPFPADIYSANLTPDASGLAGWTAAQIVTVLHAGVDDAGKALCPPMPFGPMGGFAGLTDADANAIADYLLNLPAAANAVPNECFAPTITK
jgi:mono/diheme cytochrome c family protein